MGERYLAGTATPEEKVLLDELSERNQGELTDIWVKKSDSYFVEKTRISTHRHTYGQEIKYKELGVPPEIVEFWLTCSDPKKFSRRTDNSISAYRVLARAMPLIETTIRGRLEEITKWKKIIKEGEVDQMDAAIGKLQREKEIISKEIATLKPLFGQSFLARLLDILFGSRSEELTIFRQIKEGVKKARI